MSRQTNILSFDEARAASRSRVSNKPSRASRQTTSQRDAQQRDAQRAYGSPASSERDARARQAYGDAHRNNSYVQGQTRSVDSYASARNRATTKRRSGASNYGSSNYGTSNYGTSNSAGSPYGTSNAGVSGYESAQSRAYSPRQASSRTQRGAVSGDRQARISADSRVNRQTAQRRTSSTNRSSFESYSCQDAQRPASRMQGTAGYGAERNRMRNTAEADRYSRTNTPYEVRNSWDQQEQEEENLQEQTPQKTSLKDSLKKKMRSVKAEKQFNRTIGSDDVPSESGSRAALYEMRMGKTHRRSAEMQNAQTGSSKKKKAFGGSVTTVASRFAAVAAIIFVFCGILLYQPVADLYNETRKVQKLEAEYQALEEHNEALQAEVDFLKTDEGLESYAREQYGLIGYGEHQVTVENVSSSIDKTAVTNAGHTVLTSGVKTPDTWYSGVLDIVFGYKE
ncbi:MAG: septum formation initiator family protein [Anaerotardibacter sp.]